ncbi:YraN family protein [Aliamphritea ceti]|uniref:YraN family protein n=1 Tax=Aliamphritea ceti TaxID=1524258 RepID=UPI0021C39FA4|nr:YraN family protein [Aliamphritea ceti]
MDRQQLGKDAEQQAEQFLRKQKLKLICRNFNSRFGEIDLIMLEQRSLIFIEVRSRSYKNWGGASASVDYRKQQKIIHCAEFFLSQHPEYGKLNCRFDVIAFEAGIKAHGGGDSPPIWYKDAFRL